MSDAFGSFLELMEKRVLPHRDAHPEWKRLDGAGTGGNWEVFARFMRHGARWKVHADTHLEPLLIAYDAVQTGEIDPFVEVHTNRGIRLDLKEPLAKRVHSGFRHLYIYNDRPDPKNRLV